MKNKKRIKTIQILVSSSVPMSRDKIDINEDLQKVIKINNIRPLKRRHILAIFFSSRAIDTALKCFLDYHSIRGRHYSIGKYIDKLCNNNNSNIQKMGTNEKYYYKRRIADVRNRFLHKANTYPSGHHEVNTLIAEIESLLSRMANL